MLNSIKYKARSIVKTVQAINTQAEYRRKIILNRELIAELEGGIKVYHADDYVGAVCGDLTGPAAFALPADKEIYINTPMMNLPRCYANAIIAHEIGHIVLNHKPGATYAADNHACKGHGFDIELEADRYAQDKGYDMIGALQYLNIHGYHGKTVLTRIKALAERRFGK